MRFDMYIAEQRRQGREEERASQLEQKKTLLVQTAREKFTYVTDSFVELIQETNNDNLLDSIYSSLAISTSFQELEEKINYTTLMSTNNL